MGRFSWFMYLCHVACMICVGGVMWLGSLVCSWDAVSIRVAARVDRAMSSSWLGRGLCPLCSYACTVVTLNILICVCPEGVVLISRILVQSLTPFSHRGARCFNSLSAYLRGWHRFRSCLA